MISWIIDLTSLNGMQMQPAPNSAKSGTDIRSINWRHFILGFSLLLLGFALISFVLMTTKIHSHIYYKQENGTFKYFNVLNNLTAVELLTTAQKHDIEGRGKFSSRPARIR